MENTEHDVRLFARKSYHGLLLSLGFDLSIISRFFQFLDDYEKSAKTLINKIEGGPYNRWLNGNPKRLYELEVGLEQLVVWDHVTTVAGTVHSLSAYSEEEAVRRDLIGDLWKAKNKNDVLKLKRMLLVSFVRAFFFNKNPNDSVKYLIECVKHWRGILDTHLISLKLSGQNADDEIRQAYRFLKTLDEVLPKPEKPKKAKVKA